MLESGVPNLDQILGGGIPEGDVLLVVGPAGSGKTTLSFQIAFHTASRGRKAIYVSTLGEPPARLIRHMRSFSFFDESLVGESVLLLNMYPLVKGGLQKVVDALARAVKAHEAALLVIDGLMTIRDLHPDTPEARTFLYELGAALGALECTTVLTSSVAAIRHEHPSPEFTMADGVVELSTEDLDVHTVRALRVRKLRGQAPLLGQHSLRIDGGGISVFPRIESVFHPGDAGLSPDRLSLGLPELDEMSRGGLPAGSVTLLAGSTGTGKTLACLHYLVEGVRRGEKGLFVGFRETPRQLVDRARAFGMDLETAIREGRLALLHRPQAGLEVDEVTWEIQRRLESLSPRRLALDSVLHLEWAIPVDRRRRDYMDTLAGLLRAQGVTALITKEIAQVVGPELDFSDTPLALLAENLMLLRFVEYRGELHRVLSILKMRDTDHDRSIRQYTITDRGLRVLGGMESAEGLLTGIARLPSEKRVKRRPGGRREEG